MSTTHLTLTTEQLHQSTCTCTENEFKKDYRSWARWNAWSEESLPCTAGDDICTGTSDSVSTVSSGSSGPSTYKQAELPTLPPPAIPKRRIRETRAKAAVKEQILAVRLPTPKPSYTQSHGRAQLSATPTAGPSSRSPAPRDVDYALIPEDLETHVLFGWRKRKVLDYFGYPDDIDVPDVESRLRHYGPGKFASILPFAELKTDCFQDSMLPPELCASLARIPHVDESAK